MQLIPLGIIAKNEERAIGACLRSMLADVELAEATLNIRFDIIVILDDCTDGTEAEVRQFKRPRILHSHGGIVEAQRKIANSAAFVIYSDADILIEPGTLGALVTALQIDPHLQVAYPEKSPLAPQKSTWLARSLYTYNRVNGFQTKRRYFNGKLFAIRDWKIPAMADIAPRLATLPYDRFYHFHAGMRVDDIYLSRDIISRYGVDAIREINAGHIQYRPAETFRGMFRTYRRMRMEIERLNIMFPSLRSTHRMHGIRQYDRAALRRAKWRDIVDWYFFRLSLGVCIARYHAEKIYYRYLSRSICPAWEPITESKCLPTQPISSE